MSSAAWALHALLDEDWEWRKREFPEYATQLGDHRYDGRLTDRSLEAIERRKAHEREMLDRIRRLDRAALSGEDVLSYDLFLHDKELSVEGQRWPQELIPITQMDGIQLSFPHLAQTMSFRTVEDYENWLARLSAFPRAVAQTIALMRRGMEVGWVPPAVPLRAVPDQIRGQLVDDPGRSVLNQPFREVPQGISESDRARLAAAGETAIRDSVLPALRELAEFVEGSYLPACRETIAAAALPDREAYYAMWCATRPRPRSRPRRSTRSASARWRGSARRWRRSSSRWGFRAPSPSS